MGDILLLAAGIIAVVAGAEFFFDGLLGISSRLKTAPFVVTALISGFELENLAAGIAANAKDLPGAAAGTFLGGTTFLALGITGFAAVIRPLESRVPWKPLAAVAVSPLATVLLALDGSLSRMDGAVLILWFIAVMIALARTGRTLVAPRDDEETESRPLLRLLAQLDDVTRHLHLPVAALSVPLVCLILILRERVSRWEGALLLTAYASYIAVAVLQAL